MNNNDQQCVVAWLFQSPGLTWTVLRPSSFFVNIYDDQKSLKEQGQFYRALGEVKVNWVSHEDIGEVAAKALLEPGEQRRVSLSITTQQLPNNFVVIVCECRTTCRQDLHTLRAGNDQWS